MFMSVSVWSILYIAVFLLQVLDGHYITPYKGNIWLHIWDSTVSVFSLCLYVHYSVLHTHDIIHGNCRGNLHFTMDEG